MSRRYDWGWLKRLLLAIVLLTRLVVFDPRWMERLPMRPVIELSQLTKYYRDLRALDDVSLTISPGVTGLLGPNGAGKSTLIKVLLGLVKLSGGDGQVLGRNIKTQGREIRSLIGYMPEDDCYIPGMSGVEMLRFTASLNGLPPTEGLRRSHEILDFCGMGQERYREVETYSTGMRQKLKFATAIVHDPQLLILDEPTSGLDPEERVAMLNRVQTLSRECGMATVLSTHILPDVRQVCDHVVILAGGRVRLNDPMTRVNRPDDPGVFIRTVQPIESLAKSLGETLRVRPLGDYELFVEGGLQDDRLDVDETTIWKAAASVGVTIQSIRASQNSLERVFFAAVKEAQSAHS